MNIKKKKVVLEGCNCQDQCSVPSTHLLRREVETVGSWELLGLTDFLSKDVLSR